VPTDPHTYVAVLPPYASACACRAERVNYSPKRGTSPYYVPPVRFEIVHEFDIPLDAIELAFLSPRLIEDLGPRLPNMETVTQSSHGLEGDVLTRVWAFAANMKIPDFAKPHVTKDMLSWEERTSYDHKKHEGTWLIVPRVKPEWQKYFQAKGTYAIVPRGQGCARIVRGDLDLIVPVVRPVAERLIVNEVRKIFEAEAVTLRGLSTLV
jgi:Protein of unknown function (DUF2505)